MQFMLQNSRRKKEGFSNTKEGSRRGKQDHVVHMDLFQDQVEKLGAQIVELKVIKGRHADNRYIFKILVILV